MSFNKTNSSLENNFIKYYLTPLNSSNDSNYKINPLTSFQRYTNNYNKNYFNSFNSYINSNVDYLNKPTTLYGIDENGNYNLQEAVENKNTSNDLYSSYIRENYIITRPDYEKNILYKMNNTL